MVMSWYDYPLRRLDCEEEIRVHVNKFKDVAKVSMNGRTVFEGSHDELLQVLTDLRQQHGQASADQRLSEAKNANCLCCDGFVIPAIFHDTCCDRCGREKQEYVESLPEEERLIEGQSCINGHYVCSHCWTDTRGNAEYVNPTN